MSTIFAAVLPNVDFSIFEFWLERDNGLLDAHAEALGQPRPAGACTLLVKGDDGKVIRRVEVWPGTVDEAYLRSYLLHPGGILWAGQTEINAFRLETLQEDVAEAINGWLSARWSVTMRATEGESRIQPIGRGSYTDTQIRASIAIHAIDGGKRVTAVCDLLNLSRTTVQRYRKKEGERTVLTIDELQEQTGMGTIDEMLAQW